MACRRPEDPAVVTVSMDTFRDMQHTRFDAGTAAIVASHAQRAHPAAGQNPPPPARTRDRDSHRKDRSGTNSRHHWCVATRTRRGRARSPPRSRTLDSSTAIWTRKAPTSLMGLCNRISTSTIDSLVPKIVRAIEAGGDLRRDIDIIMTCLARSDAYVGMYVTVLNRARNVAGFESAISEYSKQFLDASPFELPPSPDPVDDYDGFCASVREKRRRMNTTEAIARLGFGADIASRARDALALIADPHAAVQKDLAIAFLETAVRHGPRGCSGVPEVEAVLSIAEDTLRHGLDARTRFALVDLGDTMIELARGHIGAVPAGGEYEAHVK